MQNFRTYQLALGLVEASKNIKLKGCYGDQFKRAMLSIPLNLAEGSAKSSIKERRKYYESSLGSLREIQSIITICGLKEIERQADTLGASLFRLCQSLSRRL